MVREALGEVFEALSRGTDTTDVVKPYNLAKEELRRSLRDSLCVIITFRSRERDLAADLGIPYERVRSLHAWVRKKLRSLGVEGLGRGRVRVCGLDRVEEVLITLLSNGYEVTEVKSNLSTEESVKLAAKVSKYLIPAHLRLEKDPLLRNLTYGELEVMLRSFALFAALGLNDVNNYPPIGAIARELTRRRVKQLVRREGDAQR